MRPTASQTLGGGRPSRGKVDAQARGSRPCVGMPIAPGVCLLRSRPRAPRVARVGSLRRPRSGESPWARGTPTPRSPPPAWVPRACQDSGKQGPEAGWRFRARGPGCWTRGSPAPAVPAHAPARALSASLRLSRGQGAGGSSGPGGRERWNAPPGHLPRPGSRAGSRRAGEAQG